MKSVIPMLVWWVLVGGGDAPTEHSTEGSREAFVTEVIGTPVPARDTLALTQELLRRSAAAWTSNPEPVTLERCDPSRGDVCFPRGSQHFRCGSGQPCDHAGRLPDLVTFATQAATERPDAGFIMGYAVYSMVRQGNVDVASDLVSRCQAQEWWCNLLKGYVVHARGDYLAAEEQLRSALTVAPDSVRCEFVQPNLALAGGHRRALDRAECTEREAAADTVWWLSDPLYASEPNDRFVEHLARTLGARLLIILDYPPGDDRRRFTHDHTRGALVERMWTRLVPRGRVDSWRNRDRTRPTTYESWTSRAAARYHFVPDFEGEGFAHPTWRLEAELEDEGYTPPYGTFHEVPTQVARFRGGGAMQVAVAGTLTGSGMEGSGEPHLILSDAPGSFPVREVAEPDGPESRFLTEIPFERHVLSHEVLGDGEFGRYRVMLEPLDEVGPGISDLLLFRTDGGDLPQDLQTAADQMQPGTTVEAGREAGVYWETYGAPTDTPVRIAFEVEGESPGFFRRLISILPGVGDDGTARVGWSEPSMGLTQGRGLTLDLGALDPGSYTLVLRTEWDGQEPIEVRRPFEVR